MGPAMWCGMAPDFDGQALADVEALGRRLGLGDVRSLMERSVRSTLLHHGHSLVLHSYPHDATLPLLLREVQRDPYALARMPGGALLDIGGHIGATAILYARLHPEARVHTFEPVPLNFFYLAWNLVENQVSARQVFPRNAGLSSNGDNFTLRFSPTSSMKAASSVFGEYSILSRVGGQPVASQDVRAQSSHLGDLLGRGCLDDVAAVKLDCEGCEFDIVPAEPAFFADARRKLFGEFHARHTVILAKQSMSPEVLNMTWRTLCSRADWRRLVWLSCAREGSSRRPWLDDPALVDRRGARFAAVQKARESDAGRIITPFK